MTEYAGLDFDDTLDFLNLLQDSVPSLPNASREECVSTFLDSQLMSFSDNVDFPPGVTTPQNYLYANDKPYADPAGGIDYSRTDMTDDATFLTEFSNIHNGVKVESNPSTHSPLTPRSSSRSSNYEHPQIFNNSGRVSVPTNNTPQSNSLRGGSSFASQSNTKSPLEDMLCNELVEAKQEPRLAPKPGLPKKKMTKAPKKHKLSHNVIEKKYRTNINTKILELRDVVPSLRIKASSQDISVADLEGLTPAAKLNKASVLSKATEYIKHLENKHDSLDHKIAALQKMISQSPNGRPDMEVSSSDGVADRSTSQHSEMHTQRPNLYNDAPVNIQYASQYPDLATRAQNCGISNGNLFMGGIASILGANYVSEDNFRQMGALPLFSAKIPFSPSAESIILVKNIMTVMGMLSVGVAFYNFVAPLLTRSVGKGLGLFSLDCFKFKPLLDSERSFVQDRLSGKSKASVWALLKCYGVLIEKERNFENCVLLLLVYSVLQMKAPWTSKMLSVATKLKAGNIKMLSYEGNDKGLQSLYKLTKAMDGDNLFHCNGTMQRLLNLCDQKLINSNVRSMEYASAYVDVYLKSKKNIYSVVFGWRVLSIIRKLNLSYLDALATPLERRDEKSRQITSDFASLETALGQDSLLNNYFYGLRMIAKPSQAPQILESLNTGITEKVTTVTQLFEDCDVTDGELSDSDGDEEEVEKPKFEVLSQNTSLISSMELMDEARFITIAAALSICCLQKKQDKEALRLLQYLRFDEARPLSLLSFTALVQLVTQLIGADSESSDDADTLVSKLGPLSQSLELLLKMMLTWLKDEDKAQVLSQSLRVDLTEIVMSRALILNKL